MARIRSLISANANAQAQAAARARHKGIAKKSPQHKVVMEYVTREKKKLVTVVRSLLNDICHVSFVSRRGITNNMRNLDMFPNSTTNRLHVHPSGKSQFH